MFTVIHIRARNAERRDAVIENPRIMTKYYAVCMKNKLPQMLPFLTALQKYYWDFEEETIN